MNRQGKDRLPQFAVKPGQTSSELCRPVTGGRVLLGDKILVVGQGLSHCHNGSFRYLAIRLSSLRYAWEDLGDAADIRGGDQVYHREVFGLVPCAPGLSVKGCEGTPFGAVGTLRQLLAVPSAASAAVVDVHHLKIEGGPGDADENLLSSVAIEVDELTQREAGATKGSEKLFSVTSVRINIYPPELGLPRRLLCYFAGGRDSLLFVTVLIEAEGYVDVCCGNVVSVTIPCFGKAPVELGSLAAGLHLGVVPELRKMEGGGQFLGSLAGQGLRVRGVGHRQRDVDLSRFGGLLVLHIFS